ncbi:DEAD/DEAH box helicase family protein [Streptomyces sp. PTM05]|uniref:DEAD/DEAH box helicase family protein n=1 Tax=Streptantibioticus parmotrematis TaxID=2873249 RepID=A0ABS7R0X2_9ACTN|nr:SNF2-related protein [Streptantibioticus parmotrematis]MBY8889121.1 DEAD/DEAH box helicase family protein [Streptantibioticus parmotrematis]
MAAGLDVAALNAERWHEHLKGLVGEAADLSMVRDAIRRCRAKVLTVRDMRLILLATADDPAWEPARHAVIAFLEDRLDVARQILVSHAQVEVWPVPRFEEGTERTQHEGALIAARAVIGPLDRPVTGPTVRARTSREAQDRAALALLARIAGVPRTGESAAAERLALPGMPTEIFENRLARAIADCRHPDDELAHEAMGRARSGRLRHRDMYLLLLSAHGQAWARLRKAALERAAAMPPAPARLLHWHGEHHGNEQALTYNEELDPSGRTIVRATFQVGRTWQGPARSAWARKAARHYAATALLAQVAGLPEPSIEVDDKPAEAVRIAVPEPGQDPVKYLNKYCQKEVITKPEAQMRNLGTRVECTYSCQHRESGPQVSATAVAADKATARQAAAMKLLRKLADVECTALRAAVPPSPTPTGRVPTQTVAVPPPLPRPATAPTNPPAPLAPPARVSAPVRLSPHGTTAEALLREAIAAGAVVTFRPPARQEPAGWSVHGSSRVVLPQADLPPPIEADAEPGSGAKWRVPVAVALPAIHRTAAGASPAAVFWQRAVHLVLQLLRARLLYPALDADNLPVWRLGPVPAAAEAALEALANAAPKDAVPPGADAREVLVACGDAIADALTRTPAGDLLLGPGPWTEQAPTRLTTKLQRSVADWLDEVEDHVDGGPTPLLVVWIQTPADDLAAVGRLTAHLHLAPVGTDPADESAVKAADEVWSGRALLGGEGKAVVRPRVRRALRRAARTCPALAGLAEQERPCSCTFHPTAVEALLEQEDNLLQAGVALVWPEGLRTALSASAVIDTASGTTPGPGERPRFSVTDLLDFRWQIALDGVELTEQEMDALAEAARPLVRVRGRWVLADPVLRRRARHRLLGQLPGTQALAAALTGTVTLDGTDVPCRPDGTLADLVSMLRHGEHHPQPVPVPTQVTATLRDYQRRALTWLAHTTGCGFGALLADDMGLGKTLTALAFTCHHQQHTPGPTLVICPASLVATWCREATRFTSGLPVVAYHGPERHRVLDNLDDTSVVVTTYGLLRRDHQRLADQHWALVIADEAQHAKNCTSATARSLRALSSTSRLAITGTPVENNLSELRALLDWANPGLLGTEKEFRARWATAVEKDPHGEKAAQLTRLIAPFLLRRRKTDPGIAPELPAKIDQPRPVQLTKEQAGLYEALVRETLEQIRTTAGIERSGLVFKLLTALKQITNHPAHYLREAPPTVDEVPAFTARSAKTTALTELLEIIRERGECALVFTSYVAMGHLLTTHLAHLGYQPLFLHGTTTLTERQRMVDAFQTGRHPAMILSLKAAGTGLTLTRATHVIHYDRSWNAAVEDQATDRAHRIGQHRTVTVHRLITEHTVEDRIDELLTRKRALADAVLTGGDRALTQLTDRELADLVTLGARL